VGSVDWMHLADDSKDGNKPSGFIKGR